MPFFSRQFYLLYLKKGFINQENKKTFTEKGIEKIFSDTELADIFRNDQYRKYSKIPLQLKISRTYDVK